MPFAATEMYLEIIIPSEESHTEKERYPMAALTCRLQREMIQVNLRTKQKQAHRPENELTVPRGKGGGRDSRGVWDGHGHTAVFNMENQQGPAGQHRNSAQCHVAAWMGGEFGGEWIHVWLSLFAVQLKLSLIGYTPMQNKKLIKEIPLGRKK